MSNRETSPEIVTMAGRILAGGNPLDNQQVMNAIWLALPPKPSQQALTAALLVLKPYFENMLSLAASCLSQAEPDDGPDGPRIRTTATVGWDKITNAIVGAVEGSYSPWLQGFNYERSQPSMGLAEAARGGERTVWYNDPAFWIGGGVAQVNYDDPEDEEGNGAGKKDIKRADLSRGLALMAEKSPDHFADLLNENDDADTHDVFMQYVILGEVVYG